MFRAVGLLSVVAGISGFLANPGAADAGPDASEDVLAQVSVTSEGSPGDDYSWNPSMSANGRFVAFVSMANNLAPDQPRHYWGDVFVHDRRSGHTRMLSVPYPGAPTPDPDEGGSSVADPVITADGRFVAFVSDACDLVPLGPCDPFQTHAYVVERRTGVIEQVDVSSAEESSEGGAGSLSISRDGRFVAFASYADNLVANDTNWDSDVFVRDRLKGITTRVSVASSGSQANGFSSEPSIGGNGPYVAFYSSADNLVREDLVDYGYGVYVHDLRHDRTTAAALTRGGDVMPATSPSLSTDGKRIAFQSPGEEVGGTAAVYVGSLRTRAFALASVDAAGEKLSNLSLGPTISPDGMFVAYTYVVEPPIFNDQPSETAILIYDQRRNETVRIESKTLLDLNWETPPQIGVSWHAEQVAFETRADLLDPLNENDYWSDVYVFDRM